ncbi:MAG: chemotaxis-specific protein-glutamate methyltransferase CheB [Myxococcota bacterium]
MKSIRTLVVDDSAFNRRAIAQALANVQGVEVVGRASDGDEALRLVSELTPDLITLDLEMPRMDGFTFLRLLMARRPTPVIVVSGYSTKEKVFRALELGAIDFVAKPERSASTKLGGVIKQLTEKVRLVRHLSPAGLLRETSESPQVHEQRSSRRPVSNEVPSKIILIASSTGGPSALLELFSKIGSDSTCAAVIAQHMPERFTRTFADRLDRLGGMHFEEAKDGAPLVAGAAYVCPGGHCVEVEEKYGRFVVRVVTPEECDRYVPSADRLFASGARVLGARIVAVVLTGMGDDGAQGVSLVKAAGGQVLAESPDTAVIYGMPGSAFRTGAVDESLPLPKLASTLAAISSK